MSILAATGSERLPSVQALRGIASVLVVLFHSNENIFVGASGVDLFFVISGFIMVYTSRDHFGRSDAAKPFLLRRFLRIYPLYWIGTLLFLTVIKWPTYHRYVTSFLLIPTERTPILPPGWTLFHEIGFYLLFALCLRFTMRKAVICIFLSLVTIVVLRGLLIDIFPITWGRSISLEFGMGCIAGYFYCRGVRLGWPPALICVLAGIAIGAVPLEYRSLIQDPFRPAFWGLGWSLIFAGVVFGPKMEFLKAGPFQRLGDASYSIYIVHFTIVVGLLNNPYRGVSTFVVSILLGLGFYAIVERPLMAALNTRFEPLLRFPGSGVANAAKVE